MTKAKSKTTPVLEGSKKAPAVPASEYAAGSDTLSVRESSVSRLHQYYGSPQVDIPPEKDRNMVLSSVGQGYTELHGQLYLLQAQIRALRTMLRPHMPDYLYEALDSMDSIDAEGRERYRVSENKNSPALQALAELIDTVVDISDEIRHISSCVVV